MLRVGALARWSDTSLDWPAMGTTSTVKLASGDVTAERLPHYPVLDALRFVLAFWVAVGHLENIPLFWWMNASTPVGRFVTHAWSSVIFGTPAVIVFFVISGFCIHLPFRDDRRLQIGRYYLRRYTRILIPVAGALCVYRLSGEHLTWLGEHSTLWESPLWSLACEEIYYATYPGLRWLRNRFGWNKVLPVAFVASVGEAATHVHTQTWHTYGPLGTALILLPVWLLGCLLAEQSEGLAAESSLGGIWMWRFLAWLGCWTSEMLHFKGGVSYTQTMLWFGVLAYWWVRKEIAFGKTRAPNRLLAAAGAWSYSLYLVHHEGALLYGRLPVLNLPHLLNWFGAMISSLVFAFCFYLLVERPSHQLARKVKLAATRPVKTGVVQEVQATVVAPET
jgi:peptidoglycan/LPS O-acetylase OafA/YrhL